jgi:cytochrome c-type biogenesis protein CcmH/NrfG
LTNNEAAILRQAEAALIHGDLANAERGVRAVLRQSPNNIPALLMLADIASAVGIYHEAENQLRRAIALDPDYVEATVSLGLTLVQQHRHDEGIALLDQVLARQPSHVRAAASKANVLAQLGDYEVAAACWEALLGEVSDNAEIWMWYGHLLKTLGRQDEAVSAYRRATVLIPNLAEAWWSLAELKAARVTNDDVASMEHALANASSDSSRLFLHFAMGKAWEDRRDWRRSFEQYAAGNRLRSQLEPHDRRSVSAEVDRSIAFYSPEFFAERRGWGDPSAAPIFILGMPRAGSTLIEQILASHPQIEGTAELPYIPQAVQALVAEHWRDRSAAHPEILNLLDAPAVRAMGERYLRNASRHRKTGASFFIDKLPNNWLYTGFIHLVLPNARIIDARRSAMACCFSNYKQHFARGQTFAYSFEDLGSYYTDYVRLMGHFGETIPGLAHRVQHEALLDNPEAEIRRLLDFLSLPFDERCLTPHKNDRPVRTASSEQVRRPINRDAVDQWRHYEPWLDPLKRALGPLAET